MTATAKMGRQIADKLKEVQTLEGETRWVLVHVEVQGQWEADFPRRIFRFDARLFDEFEQNDGRILGPSGPKSSSSDLVLRIKDREPKQNQMDHSKRKPAPGDTITRRKVPGA